MSSRTAGPYLSFETILRLFKLLEMKHLDFTPEESELLTAEVKQKYYSEFFHSWDKKNREGNDASCVSRRGLRSWMELQIMISPVGIFHSFHLSIVNAE
jgi:hypothetical protein